MHSSRMRTGRALTVWGGGGGWCNPEGIFLGKRNLKKKKIREPPRKLETPPKISDPPKKLETTPPRKFQTLRDQARYAPPWTDRYL